MRQARTRALVAAAAGLAAAAIALAGCGAASPHPDAASSAPAAGASPSQPHASARRGSVPRPRHTVVVILENRSYGQVIGNPYAPYINSLARQGALFTDSRAVTHPSEPNYLALFSGSTQGLTNDSCPHHFSAANLGGDLTAAHLTFTGYAESLPAPGSRACDATNYSRRHVPWIDFASVPASADQPFTSFPTGHYGRLPTVSFVVPNLCDDMHNCSVATGDAWLRQRLGGYARWAMSHDSLLVVTWDENGGGPGNQIATIFAGQMVRPGRYSEPITHYSVLATIEDAYGLRRDGHAASATPITGVWR